MSYKTLLSDQELFQAFKKGDQRAFSTLYEAFKRAVYITTMKMVGSAEDAEDLTVQTFAKSWERRESIESMIHLRNFLFVTARNSSINFLQERNRAKVRLVPLAPGEADVTSLSADTADQLFAELVEAVMEIVEAMPRLRKLVFRMRYLEERPVKDVAEALDLTVHSVYWHSREALIQIRNTVFEKANASSPVLLLLIFLATASPVYSSF